MQAFPLAYHLLHPNQRTWGSRELVEAYRLWREVWQQTLHELDGVTHISSDQFTRQHEIGALFCGERCIGLTAYRFVDLSRPCNREDSYFDVWPETALKALVRDGPQICIGSQLTVAPDWRRHPEVPVKELLLALAVQRFLESRTDTMAGVMRNDRGMGTLAYRLGAQSLVKRATLHGVPVDLVAFYRRSLEPPLSYDPRLRALLCSLWAGARQEMRNEERVG